MLKDRQNDAPLGRNLQKQSTRSKLRPRRLGNALRIASLFLLGIVAGCGAPQPLTSDTLKSGYGPRCSSGAECPSTGTCREGRCAPYWEGGDRGDAGLAGGVEGSCGNGVIERGEACDDGNSNQEDACLNDCKEARCGDGHVWSNQEACDEDSERCGDDCQLAFDGRSPERAALSCRHLLRLHPQTTTGQYWIQPGETPWRVVCEMDFDNGGWTRVARVGFDEVLWDAWNEGQEGSESFGIPIGSLSQCCDGEDLTYHFVVDGERYPSRFQDVMSAAFVTSAPAASFDDDGVMISPAPGEEFVHCPATLTRQNEWWNWSISQSRHDGCSGYRADGFLLTGAAGRDEQATKIFGLGRFEGDTFTSVEVYAREEAP